MIGYILLDKPIGVSSFTAVKRVARILSRQHGVQVGGRRGVKIGHGGTLDPLASGLLVVLLGKATKLQRFIQGGDKSYQGHIILGCETTTGDSEGEVVSRVAIDDDFRRNLPEMLVRVSNKFTGIIEQRPPSYSAVKVDGVRSYSLARKGEEVLLPLREVTIGELQLQSVGEDSLSYRASCSSGTYVRSLAVDIGRELGCLAHAGSIRRVASKFFRIEDAVSLEELEATECLVRPVEELVSDLPVEDFSSEDFASLYAGRQEPLSQIPEKEVGDYLVVRVEETFKGLLRYCDRHRWEVDFLVS